MFYNNPSISPTQQQQQQQAIPSQLVNNQLYKADLYGASPPQVICSASLSPQLDMLNHMHDLSLNSSALYNSSPESTISTEIYTQDFSISDPLLPDLYPKAKPLPLKIKKLAREPFSPATQKRTDPESYRRQIDEKLANINFDDITVSELKEVLRERGLSATGRKAELIKRLKQEHDLIIQQRQPHALSLKRRSALDHKNAIGSTKISYHPYYTPPLHHHASISIEQLNHRHSESDKHLASSLPTSPNHFINDLRQESYDIWDDQMLENFLKYL